MKVLVIIPAFNEQESIVDVVHGVMATGYDYVVVNDGSTDATYALCVENGFNVLNLPQNLGIGGAVQTGHKYALRNGYDVDVQFDGDGQHDANCISALINEIEQGADLVIGSRFLTKEGGFKSTALRRVGIIWISKWIRLLTGQKASDPTSGFRASGKRAIALYARSYPTDYPEPESIVLAQRSGLEIRDTAVVMHERRGGTSSIGGLSSLYYMIKVSLSIAILSITRRIELQEDSCS